MWNTGKKLSGPQTSFGDLVILVKTPILPQAVTERPAVCHKSNSKIQSLLKSLVPPPFSRTTEDFRLPAEALARPAKAGKTLGRS